MEAQQVTRRLEMIKGLIFDLDDTLYPSSQWLKRALAWGSGQMGLNEGRAARLANDYIEEHGKADHSLYNHILTGLGQVDSARNIQALSMHAERYCVRPGEIELYPGLREELCQLKENFTIAVVADGPVGSQVSKMRVLGLQEIADVVIYSDEIEKVKARRPDLRPFYAALAEMELRSTQVMVVGDNPAKDFMAYRNRGFLTARVLTGEFSARSYPSQDHRPHFEVEDATQISAFFKRGLTVVSMEQVVKPEVMPVSVTA